MTGAKFNLNTCLYSEVAYGEAEMDWHVETGCLLKGNVRYRVQKAVLAGAFKRAGNIVLQERFEV